MSLLHQDSLLLLKVARVLEYYPILVSGFIPVIPPIFHGIPWDSVGFARHLHQNCLENDSLLLEARPLAKQLATQLTAAKRRWASEDLATMAGSLGYLGIIDVRCSEERSAWGLNVQSSDNCGCTYT